MSRRFLFFFFNDTATTEIYTLSLHDALPISPRSVAFSRAARSLQAGLVDRRRLGSAGVGLRFEADQSVARSEEHTSELQSRPHLVCRLLLEKKKNMKRLKAVEC